MTQGILVSMNMRHAVLLTVITALILSAVGLYFVQRQRAVVPTGGGASWNTVGGYVDSDVTPVEKTVQPPLPEVDTQTGPETLTIPKPKTVATTSAKVTPAKNDGAFDYNVLLARLHHEPATVPAAQAAKTYEDLTGAFTFVPSKQNVTQKIRTKEQESLFIYGNEIGRRIQGFAAVNPNMAQTVVNQATHRDNPSYGAAVRELGTRYAALGENILSIEDVPTSAVSQHKALGEAYVNLGKALAAVPEAADDQAFLAAVTTYNNKADAFTLSFVAMATMFSTLGVTFDESDSGSAFSFRH